MSKIQFTVQDGATSCRLDIDEALRPEVERSLASFLFNDRDLRELADALRTARVEVEVVEVKEVTNG